MQESLTRIYKEYKLSRDSIQLTDAFVAHCSADALEDLNDAGLYEEAPLNALKLKHSYEWISDNVARGYLLSEVDVLTGKTNQTIAKFSIKVVGIFKVIADNNVEKKELVRRLELQIVPQLLPYVRSALTSLSSLMTLPPVVLPTMDVLLSMKKNGQA